MDVRRWLGGERWRVMGLWMLIWVERAREMWFVELREVIGVVGVVDETGEVVDVLDALMCRGDGGGGGCGERGGG